MEGWEASLSREDQVSPWRRDRLGPGPPGVVSLHREMDERSFIPLLIHRFLATSEVAGGGQKWLCGAVVPIGSLN